MDISLSQTTDEARPCIVGGVTFMVKPIYNHQTLIAQAIIEMTNKAVHDDFYSLDSSTKSMYLGLAMHAHYVESFTPYTLTDRSDPENPVVIEVSFDAPTEHKNFETMGQQMLALDHRTQDKLTTFALGEAGFKNHVEVKAMGNSEKPSSSTQE